MSLNSMQGMLSPLFSTCDIRTIGANEGSSAVWTGVASISMACADVVCRPARSIMTIRRCFIWAAKLRQRCVKAQEGSFF